jgi:hypothetical protein
MKTTTVQHEVGCLHIETPLGIVNIRVGLADMRGREVESIEIMPENKVRRIGGRPNVRLVKLKGWKKRRSK